MLYYDTLMTIKFSIALVAVFKNQMKKQLLYHRQFYDNYYNKSLARFANSLLSPFSSVM